MIFNKEELAAIEEMVERKDIASMEAMRNGSPQHARAKVGFVRSALMVSGHRVKHLNRLDDLGADMAILNLEDGVAAELKETALHLIGLFLGRAERIFSKTVVRINPIESGGRDEIAYLNTVLPDAIRVPKIKSAADVEEALELVDERICLHLSIETKEAWRALDSLRLSPRVEAFYLGVYDLLASMNLPISVMQLHNPTMLAILSRFLLESSVLGVLPVSFVYQEYNDVDGFENWCLLEKKMGYHAKGCISPLQAEIANRVFMPDEEERLWAQRVVELFESRDDSSGFADEELGFVDEPIYKNAKNILALFKRLEQQNS
ncbi:HpcH/HpaI aldolase/citrate lyase family protein [Hydrogenimonas sp.]